MFFSGRSTVGAPKDKDDFTVAHTYHGHSVANSHFSLVFFAMVTSWLHASIIFFNEYTVVAAILYCARNFHFHWCFSGSREPTFLPISAAPTLLICSGSSFRHLAPAWALRPGLRTLTKITKRAVSAVAQIWKLEWSPNGLMCRTFRGTIDLYTLYADLLIPYLIYSTNKPSQF